MAALAGVVTLVASLSLGVPLAPLLAVWVAICNPIPQVGGFLGAVPFVALGLTQSAVVGVICLIVFLIYQQTENHILQPLIIGRAVRLTPPATMVAALVGVAAGGVIGGLLAIPMLGASKAIYLALRTPELEIPARVDPPSEHLPLSELTRSSSSGAAKKPRCTMCVTVSSVSSPSNSRRRDTRKYANRSSNAISAEIDAASACDPRLAHAAAERGGDLGERPHAERRHRAVLHVPFHPRADHRAVAAVRREEPPEELAQLARSPRRRAAPGRASRPTHSSRARTRSRAPRSRSSLLVK